MKWDEHSEEVWSDAGGDQQADLTPQQAEGGAAQPAEALRSTDGINRLRNYGSIRRPRRKPHQISTSDGILITGEADPGSEDHGAHKENVTQELSWGGQVNHGPSVQVKAQRDDFHGHHHLRASIRFRVRRNHFI